jgi:predicted site-specific integrase-resolvase
MSSMRLRGLLSARQAAEILGITPRATRRYAQEGRLRGRRLDGRWVFGRSDVLRFAGIPRPVGYPKGKSRGKQR